MNIRPKKFALFGNVYQAKKSANVLRLLSILSKHQAEVYIQKEFYQFLTKDQKMDIQAAGVFENDDFSADMVLSMGGDGTFLKAASYVGNKNIPILGINTGRLGFLADVSPEEMEETFEDIYKGNYKIEDRSVLHVFSEGQPLKGYPYGLNEIAVLKRDSSSMITIHTSINGAYLTTYQADGLVIATPTGSTAYSLSAGGPVIDSRVKCICITPICPHSLTLRPIIFPDNSVIDIKYPAQREKKLYLTIDGRKNVELFFGDKVSITKSNRIPHLIRLKKHSFYTKLQDKLGSVGS